MNELYNILREEFKDKEYAHAYLDEFLNTYIATQIKVLREQRNLTQAELASLTVMKQSRISLLENANYSMWSISTLQKIAEAFDVSLKVSFESFSTRINDIVNFNRQSLERLSRENDLSSSVCFQVVTTDFNPSNITTYFSNIEPLAFTIENIHDVWIERNYKSSTFGRIFQIAEKSQKRKQKLRWKSIWIPQTG